MVFPFGSDILRSWGIFILTLVPFLHYLHFTYIYFIYIKYLYMYIFFPYFFSVLVTKSDLGSFWAHLTKWFCSLVYSVNIYCVLIMYGNCAQLCRLSSERDKTWSELLSVLVRLSCLLPGQTQPSQCKHSGVYLYQYHYNCIFKPRVYLESFVIHSVTLSPKHKLIFNYWKLGKMRFLCWASL